MLNSLCYNSRVSGSRLIGARFKTVIAPTIAELLDTLIEVQATLESISEDSVVSRALIGLLEDLAKTPGGIVLAQPLNDKTHLPSNTEGKRATRMFICVAP